VYYGLYYMAKPISLRVPDEVKADWEKAAEAAGLSLSEYVRQTVDQKVHGGRAGRVSALTGVVGPGSKKTFQPDPK
jgi:Mobilization protein NikA